MAEPNVNAVGFGPGLLYIAPLGTAEPTTISTALDPAWVPLGYTDAGTSVAFVPTVTKLYAAESYYPLAAPVTAWDATISMKLLELTLKNLSAVMNAGVVTPTGANFAFTPPVVGTEVNVMLLLKGKNDPLTSQPSFIEIYRKCIQSGTVTIDHTKAAFSGLSATFTLLDVGGGIAPFTWLSDYIHNAA